MLASRSSTIPRLTASHLPGVNTLRNPLLLIRCPLSRSRVRRILRMPAIHPSKVIAIGMSHLQVILLLVVAAK